MAFLVKRFIKQCALLNILMINIIIKATFNHW